MLSPYTVITSEACGTDVFVAKIEAYTIEVATTTIVAKTIEKYNSRI